ncbi:TonB-dependent receptor domain-containing protein [Brevundimonas sp. NPDC092305]|uniref:TonB-dependent receptor domain-containing protein n=1 Tax=Brevundimonas sp. NPDC092305 TaxID=3363957 RepID=UPI003817711E
MTVHNLKLALTGASALSLMAGVANAQEATQVEDVVVTAAGYEQRITQAPASISVLPRQEIEELRATSIAEILNNVEGVDTGAGVGKTGGQTINIRGMGPDYTLILIDGRRQNPAGSVTPNGFGETSTSFLPPVSSIERIEVVRGPVSTLYGSDAMGGVVNIITRKVGDVWAGSLGANYTLQGDDEFGNIWGANLYAAGPVVKDVVGLAVRGSWQDREQSELTFERVDGVETPVTGFGRSATAYEIWSLGARVALQLHPDHDLWLDVDTANQWYDNSANQLGTQGVAGGYADALEFNRDQQVLAHNWRLPFGTLESTLSRNYTEKLGRIVPALVPVTGGQARNIESTSIVFDTKLHSAWRNHNFTVGGQYWDAEMIDGVAPTAFTFEQWALFAEDEWRFTDSFALTGGVRYDDHSTFGDHVSPRLYGVWNATDQWTIKGGVSAGYKAPRVEQLAPGINGFGGQGRIPLIGSPDLTPETSVSTELAVFYDNGWDLRASLTAFHNTFEDKIASGVPVANCSAGVTAANYQAGNYPQTGCVDVGFYPSVVEFGQSVNIDEAETSGFEATARWNFAEAWSVQGNYTYTDSEQKSGSAAGQPLTDTPRHMLNGQLRWRATDDLNLWVRGEYRSERYRGPGAAFNAWGDYKAYELVHFGGSYQVTDRVSLNATVYNLFDTDFVRLLPFGTPVQYTPEYANNQEPRRLYLGVNLDF